MGIAFGAGLLLGVQTALTGSLHLLAPLTLLLGLMCLMFRDVVRASLACLAIGCLIGGVAGAWRAPDETATRRDETPSLIEAEVVDDPRLSESGIRAPIRWLDADGIQRDDTAFLPPVPNVQRGDQIIVTGRFGDDGSLFFADTVRIEQETGSISTARLELRKSITHGIYRRVPGSPGTLALGLVTGDDSGLTEREDEHLRQAGLSHITAVSGWNVTLVLVIAGFIFARLGWRAWYWLLVQGIALSAYVWIIGLQPPITRAAIMGALALIGFYIGRPAHTLTLLTLAAGIMVAVSPEILGSLSFQLSVTSMIGLIVVSRYVMRMDRRRAILTAPAVMSGAAGLATAPLLAARFGEFSMATVPANTAVAFLLPSAAIGGILTVCFDFLPLVGEAIGWYVWIVCRLILEVAHYSASFPGAFWRFGPLSPLETVGVYLALIGAALPILPEGRVGLRASIDWIESDPVRATLVGVGIAAVVVLAAIIVEP